MSQQFFFSPLNPYLALQENTIPGTLSYFIRLSEINFIYFVDLFFNIYLAALDLSCGMWDLVPWLGIKPMSLGISESQPLDHEGSPRSQFYDVFIPLVKPGTLLV